MTEQANPKKDLTQKELIKILEQIDSERTNQNLREYSAAKKELED